MYVFLQNKDGKLSLLRTINVYVGKWFSTFLRLRNPSFVLLQFGGTPSYNLQVNRCQVHILAAPLELFAAPKGSAAPWLRTTDVGHWFSTFCGWGTLTSVKMFCSALKAQKYNKNDRNVQFCMLSHSCKYLTALLKKFNGTLVENH